MLFLVRLLAHSFKLTHLQYSVVVAGIFERTPRIVNHIATWKHRVSICSLQNIRTSRYIDNVIAEIRAFFNLIFAFSLSMKRCKIKILKTYFKNETVLCL